MLEARNPYSKKYILAIHSTNNHFGFAYKDIDNLDCPAVFFIKSFNKDLSNNLISDLATFLSERSFHCIERISISIGPSNFNATRLIVVLARTISQQIKCPLDYYSSYRIMAKRIVKKNNLMKKNKYFWIINKLARRGYIAGKYMIDFPKSDNHIFTIQEIIRPRLLKEIENANIAYEVDYNIKDDLEELIKLSEINNERSELKSWEEVLPIYPLSPTS